MKRKGKKQKQEERILAKQAKKLAKEQKRQEEQARKLAERENRLKEEQERQKEQLARSEREDIFSKKIKDITNINLDQNPTKIAYHIKHSLTHGDILALCQVIREQNVVLEKLLNQMEKQQNARNEQLNNTEIAKLKEQLQTEREQRNAEKMQQDEKIARLESLFEKASPEAIENLEKSEQRNRKKEAERGGKEFVTEEINNLGGSVTRASDLVKGEEGKIYINIANNIQQPTKEAPESEYLKKIDENFSNMSKAVSNMAETFGAALKNLNTPISITVNNVLEGASKVSRSIDEHTRDVREVNEVQHEARVEPVKTDIQYAKPVLKRKENPHEYEIRRVMEMRTEGMGLKQATKIAKEEVEVKRKNETMPLKEDSQTEKNIEDTQSNSPSKRGKSPGPPPLSRQSFVKREGQRQENRNKNLGKMSRY